MSLNLQGTTGEGVSLLIDKQGLWHLWERRCIVFATNIDLTRTLRATRNLRRKCGLTTIAEIPSESSFSRVFAEFCTSGLETRAHDSLVEDYLSDKIIDHISQDSTPIVGR